ncbi:hypothetical protein ECG_01545 [Echinococcus granulosus]|uniref:CD22 n=1 Tax=Echinococcus granulosus TaxID=6210 RepID=A0A068W7B5_ECHGR|nr:hypothetical protein ECG_01545 [Echinococcus granulosus]CDS15526.1 hypothetical protein EgrG_002016700 [Echinococcus granulosus]
MAVTFLFAPVHWYVIEEPRSTSCVVEPSNRPEPQCLTSDSKTIELQHHENMKVSCRLTSDHATKKKYDLLRLTPSASLNNVTLPLRQQQVYE